MNWNQVISDIGPRLYRYFSASFSAEAASDLTQETLIRLVSRFEEGSYDPVQGTMLMYAYGIARLVRMEAWKKTLPEDSYADPKDYDFRIEASAKDVDSDSTVRLRLALNELPEIQKQVVLLHIDEELKLGDIAQIVGLPLNTVKSHIHRAKENLKMILADQGDE